MNSASRLVCCTSQCVGTVEREKVRGFCAVTIGSSALQSLTLWWWTVLSTGRGTAHSVTWRIHFFVVSQWDCGRGEGVKYIREIYCVEEEVRKLACSRVLGMELLFRTPFMECGSSHIFIWRRIGRMGGLGLAPKSFVLKGCSGVRCITFPLSITGCLYFLLLKSIWSCLSACSLFSCEGDKPIVRK